MGKVCSSWNNDNDAVLEYLAVENAHLKQEVSRLKHSQAPSVASAMSSPRLTPRGGAQASPRFDYTNIVNELTQIESKHRLRMMSNVVLTADDMWKSCKFRPWANILQWKHKFWIEWIKKLIGVRSTQARFCPKCLFPISPEIHDLLYDSVKTVAENPLVSESTVVSKSGKLALDSPQISRSYDNVLALPQESESVLQSLTWQEEIPTEHSMEYDPGSLEKCKAQLSPETLLTFNRVCPQFEWPRLDEYVHVEKRPAQEHKNALYDGEWLENKPYGRGVLVYANNEIYLGNVDRARRTGYGLYIYKDGSYYIGDWENDTMEGQGSMYNVNGYKYTGAFSDGLENGEGQATFANGNIFEGTFTNGKSGTSGKMIFTSGDIYKGKFKNQLPDGHGSINYADQTSYVGRWKAGKRHGEGTMTNVYGAETTGQYRNNKLMSGLPFQKSFGDINLKIYE